MRLVATEACRRARNGNRFLALAAKETGLRLEVIRPEEEARLAVISCAPLVAPTSRQVLVFDIGGGSTELVWLDLSEIAPENRAQAIVNLKMNREAGGGVGKDAARIVDFISVPLGVATLHERYADVADDGARFALMSWYFEELHRLVQAVHRDAVGGGRRRVPDDRHLGDGDDGGRGAPGAEALRPAQGRRDAADLARPSRR